MPANVESLLAGRNNVPLSERDVTSASNTFLGMDRDAPFRFEEGARTRFRVVEGQENEETIAEIVFGPDLFPGRAVVDPNSSLSMRAAIGHELAHYHRWLAKTELQDERLLHIDEAQTSLEAILRYPNHLNEHEVRQLVADALMRLQIYAQMVEAENGER